MGSNQQSDSYFPDVGETFSVSSGDESQAPIPQKASDKKSLTAAPSAESVVVNPDYQPNPLIEPVATRNVRWPSYSLPTAANPNAGETFQVAAQPDVGYASDIAKSVAGQGVLGATADVASLPRTIMSPLVLPDAEKARTAGVEKAGEKQVELQPADLSEQFFSGLTSMFPTQEAASEWVRQNLPFTQYEPQTTPGKIAGSAARVAGNVATTELPGAVAAATKAPSVIEGAVQIAKNLATPVAAGSAAGATSEVAGEVADRFLPESAQPYVRVAASLVGGLGAGKLIDAVHSLAVPSDTAYNEVLKALTEDLKSDSTKLNQVQNAIESGSQPTIYDMAGKRTMAVLKKYGYLNDEAKEKVNGLIQDLAERSKSAAPNVVDHLESLYGGDLNAGKLQESIQRENKASVDSIYDLARKNPAAQNVWNSNLADMLKEEPILTADKAVRKLSTTPDLNIKTFQKGTADQVVPSSILDDSGKPISYNTIKGVPDQLPNLNYWDQIKRNLDDQISVALRAGEKSKASYLTDTKNRLLSEVDNAIPQYGQARNAAANAFGESNSIEAGYSALKKMDSFSNNDFVKNFSKMNDEQKRLFSLGVGSAIKDQINNQGIDSFLSIVNKPDQAARIRMALGDDAYYSLLSKAQSESFLSKVKPPVQPSEEPSLLKKSIGQYGVPTALLATSGLAYDLANMPAVAAAGAATAAGLAYKGIMNFSESRIAPEVIKLMSDPSKTKEFADLMRSNPNAVTAAQKIIDGSKKALIYGQSAAPSQYTPESLRNFQESQNQQSLMQTQKSDEQKKSSQASYDYNIGNIRSSNSKNAPFKKYNSPEEGIVDAANLLKRYPENYNNGKDMSLLQIGKIYAPTKDNNNPIAWAKGIAKIAGLKPNQPLDLNDNETLKKIIPALHKMERGAAKSYSNDVYANAIDKAFPQEGKSNDHRDVRVMFPQHGQASGGRIERKSGGRVDNVQPLVDELMRKFKQAKKVTDKTTEPLLDQPDDAIVKALKVAQDAI